MNNDEIKLTDEEMLFNEFIYAVMDNQGQYFTPNQLSQLLNSTPERIKKALLLFEQENDVEKEEKDGQIYWSLNMFGKDTSRMLQRAYLKKDDSYEPKKLTQEELTDEHIMLLEYFADATEESPKPLPPEIFATHRAKENPYCIEYPLLADILETGYIDNDTSKGFQFFYFTAKGEKTLKLIHGFSLSWEQLSPYQREVLKILKTTSTNQPIPYLQIREDLEVKLNISKDNMKNQLKSLRDADLIDYSHIRINDLATYYITNKGQDLLKNNN